MAKACGVLVLETEHNLANGLRTDATFQFPHLAKNIQVDAAIVHSATGLIYKIGLNASSPCSKHQTRVKGRQIQSSGRRRRRRLFSDGVGVHWCIYAYCETTTSTVCRNCRQIYEIRPPIPEVHVGLYKWWHSGREC